MINSRQKGKVGEREFALKLRAYGYSAARGVQYKGTPDSPDVICVELPFHWEVKLGGRIELDKAYAQARAQCGKLIPAVAHRSTRRGKNSEDLRTTSSWMVTMSADDFLSLTLLQNIKAFWSREK